MSLNTSSANNTRLPVFRALQVKFEQRGVCFPVPTIVEFKERFGRNAIPVEESNKLDERGEPRRKEANQSAEIRIR